MLLNAVWLRIRQEESYYAEVHQLVQCKAAKTDRQQIRVAFEKDNAVLLEQACL